MKSIISTIITCLFLSGCGTILYGPKQDVPIHSEPAGATILVDGQEVGTTPAVISLTRGDEHEIVVAKEGFPSQVIPLKKRVNGASVMSVILPGGLLFLTIDSSNGSLYTLAPEKVLAIFDTESGTLTQSCYFKN